MDYITATRNGDVIHLLLWKIGSGTKLPPPHFAVKFIKVGGGAGETAQVLCSARDKFCIIKMRALIIGARNNVLCVYKKLIAVHLYGR